MKHSLIAALLAIGVLGTSSASLADDPQDPDMRTKAARERDREMTRRLNQAQLDYVRKRDAEYAKGWEGYPDYQTARADYERKMREWRHAVRMCDAGHVEYCDNR